MTDNYTVTETKPLELVDEDLRESDPAEVKRLASSIDYYSVASIASFGGEVADRSSAYAEDLLSAARTDDLDGTGKKLNEIVLAARSFNLDAIENQLSRQPVFGGWFKWLNLTREKVMIRFDSIKDQIEKLVADIDRTAALLNERNADYQSMYDGTKNDYALLGHHVEAIRLRLFDLDTELKSLGDAGVDAVTNEKIALLESNKHALSKRADDLEVLSHAALQTLPMVRVIQFNNLALIDKFNTIQRLTLPSWKKSFLLALAMDEQRGAVELANVVDDATNEFMRRNADMLHQNAVDTAKSNQRLVVDVATLRHVHNKIIDTLEDVRSAHEDGARSRGEAIAELEQLRGEMVQGVKSVSGVAAA